jgi:uncharacterized Zn-binding protein involved in type VI secretion
MKEAMVPPAARITDATTHGAPLAPGPGSPNVLIGYMPAWRALIDTHACPAVNITGADGVGVVMMGSPTVLINYMMACRMGDIVVEVPGLALGPANPIIMGCPTVMIGDVGMGAPGPATMGAMAGALGGSTAVAAHSLAQASEEGVGLVRIAGNPLLSQAIGDGGPNSSENGQAQKKVWVEIELVDQDGKAVPNEPYSIQLPDGTVSEGSTDSDGLARVDGIDPGNCQITFPSLDQRSWKRK